MVAVFNLIDRESGGSFFLDQSDSEEDETKATPDNFRQSTEKCSNDHLNLIIKHTHAKRLVRVAVLRTVSMCPKTKSRETLLLREKKIKIFPDREHID